MDCGCLKIFLLENDIYVDTERVLLRLVYRERIGRAEINIRQNKENKVSNTHATIQHAQWEGHLPHVVHIHGWKVKERNRKTANQHYQENITH